MRTTARILALALTAPIVAGLVLPVRAYAEESESVLFDGTAGTVADMDGTDVYEGALGLRWGAQWEYAPGTALDPRMVQRLPDGSTLTASRGQGVYLVDAGGQITWSWLETDAQREGLPTADLMWIFSAYRSAVGFGGVPNTTLIVDRLSDIVFEVDQSGRVIWQYRGTPGRPLMDPFYATRLANGNTLIVDDKESQTVFEIDTDAYEASAPHYGFEDSDVVWSFGGSGVLVKPKHAERQPNGDTLISDEEGQRVVRVTLDGVASVEFDVSDLTDPAERPRFAPSATTALADGSLAIADTDGDQILIVDASRTIVRSIDAATDGIKQPRAIDQTEDGTLVIADTGNARLVEIGYSAAGSAATIANDCGLPGVLKRFTRLTWLADVPAGDAVAISYSIDGLPWVAAGSSGAFSFPAEVEGVQIRIRAELSSHDRMHSPELTRVTVTSEPVPQDIPPPSDGDGGGAPTASTGEDTSGNESGATTGDKKASSEKTGGAVRVRPRTRVRTAPGALPKIMPDRSYGNGGAAGGADIEAGEFAQGESTLIDRGFVMAATRTGTGGEGRGAPSLGGAASAAGLATLAFLYVLGLANMLPKMAWRGLVRTLMH